MSVGGLSLASILAACGGDGSNAGSGPAAAGDKVDFGAAPGDNIKFANWPLYIDTALNKDTGQKYHPSLAKFTEDTGINVDYEAVINDNASFFGELLPRAAGRPGHRLGHHRHHERPRVHRADPERVGDRARRDARPNFDANAAPFAKDPVVRPGQQVLHGVAVGTHRRRLRHRQGLAGRSRRWTTW